VYRFEQNFWPSASPVQGSRWRYCFGWAATSAGGSDTTLSAQMLPASRERVADKRGKRKARHAAGVVRLLRAVHSAARRPTLTICTRRLRNRGSHRREALYFGGSVALGSVMAFTIYPTNRPSLEQPFTAIAKFSYSEDVHALFLLFNILKKPFISSRMHPLWPFQKHRSIGLQFCERLVTAS
jgi:hypothetical protein